MTDKPEALVIQRRLAVLHRRNPRRGCCQGPVEREIPKSHPERYANAMGKKDVFPPVVLYFDGMTNWLADGLHRLEAAKQIGRPEVEAEVREGTERDALMWAMSANPNHGLRMRLEDKKRAACLLLNDPEWSQWNNSEISRQCGLSAVLSAAFLIFQLQTVIDNNMAGRVAQHESGGRVTKTRDTATRNPGWRCRFRTPPVQRERTPCEARSGSNLSGGPGGAFCQQAARLHAHGYRPAGRTGPA